MKREEIETVFDGYCPLGHVCKKKNAKMCSKSSSEECKAFVLNHLMRFPYHELTEQMAEDVLVKDHGDLKTWVRKVEYNVLVEYDQAGEFVAKFYCGEIAGTGTKRTASGAREASSS